MQRSWNLSKILVQKQQPSLIFLRCPARAAGTETSPPSTGKETGLTKTPSPAGTTGLQISDKPMATVQRVPEERKIYPKQEKWATPPLRITVNVPDDVDVSAISGVPEEHVVARRARIFVPAKAAPQSGNNNTKLWKIELDNRERWENPLIGWASSGDPLSNISINLDFSRKEDAMRFCERQGWEYTVDEPSVARIKPKSYGVNYAWNSKTRIGTK